MTTTPLFHETARQLWVEGLLSRETQARLMMTPIRMRDVTTLTSQGRTFQQVGCDYIIPNNPANLERNREILRRAAEKLARPHQCTPGCESGCNIGRYDEGLNARLDRLG